ncbi:hypothetical protein HDU96_001342 [Phlyctochytrium bullatum]|nr:hypothetical protein HDU96_001342 [Phlyctochytrium bullatum]
MVRRQSSTPASQVRRNPRRGAAVSSEPMSEPVSETTGEVAAPGLDAAPPDTAGLPAPSGSSQTAPMAAGASSSLAALADAEDEVPLAVSRPRPSGPSVSFAPVTPVVAPAPVAAPPLTTQPLVAATSRGAGNATSAPTTTNSSPSRRRSSAANSDLLTVLQAMTDNNRLLLEGIRADNRLMMESMRECVRDGIREGVRALADLPRESRAASNPPITPPRAPPGPSASRPAPGGAAASVLLPQDDDDDYVDQFIASAVRQGNQPSAPPLPPASRLVDGARFGSAVASSRGDPPAALTANLRGSVPGARAASLALWFETFTPAMIADLRLMTADEANAAAFGPPTKNAKDKTKGPWLFPSALAASQAVRTYSDRVLIIWNDPRMVPRSCPREVLLPTIQATLTAFANRIAVMDSSLGTAEHHTVAACTAVLNVLEEAWQDPSTALEYTFPSTFVDTAVNNGIASARSIVDARQSFTSQPSGGSSGKRAAGDYSSNPKRFKGDSKGKEREKCKNWNNGGCKDVCDHGRPHRCIHCDSSEHRAVECKSFDEAKARFIQQKK